MLLILREACPSQIFVLNQDPKCESLLLNDARDCPTYKLQIKHETSDCPYRCIDLLISISDLSLTQGNSQEKFLSP